MSNYLAIIILAAMLYCIVSRGIEFITKVRLKLGLSKLIRIVITDNQTIVIDALGHEIIRDDNAVFYTTGRLGKNKLVGIGSMDRNYDVWNMPLNKIVCINNFIEDISSVVMAIHDFGYQYITWYVMKSKREMHVSALIILSASIDVQVTSDSVKNIIRSELEKAIQTNRPKFYNIVGIN